MIGWFDGLECLGGLESLALTTKPSKPPKPSKHFLFRHIKDLLIDRHIQFNIAECSGLKSLPLNF